MKSLFTLLYVFLAQQSFACIDYSTRAQICPNQTVYKGNQYPQGATVLGVNLLNNTATVRSNYTGNTKSEKVKDLYITDGCIGQVCVENTIYVERKFPIGANVLAINPHLGSLTVKSNDTGNVLSVWMEDVDVTKGCLFGVCVGDTIYKGDTYPTGAIVLAINNVYKTVTVKSNYTKNLNVEYPPDLSVTNMCADYSLENRKRSLKQ